MLSKKLLHVNSFYRDNNLNQTPSNFAFSNPNPSMSHVRRIELLSCSLMNSEPNISDYNNTLRFIRREPLVRTLAPASVYLGNGSVTASSNSLGVQLSYCEVGFKWYKAGSSSIPYIVLFINPATIEWSYGPKTGASIVLNTLVVTATNVQTSLTSFIFPRENATDEIAVFIPEELIMNNNPMNIQFNVTADDGTFSTFACQKQIDYANYNLENDPSVVQLSNEYYIGLVPVKIGNQLRGFQYLLMSISDDIQSVSDSFDGIPLPFELFPTVNSKVAVSKKTGTGITLFRTDIYHSGKDEPPLVINTNYFNYFELNLNNQIIQEPLIISEIQIPEGQYEIDGLISTLQNSFQTTLGITMTKFTPNGGWFDSIGRLQFTLSEYCLFDKSYYGTYNPMSYIIGLTGENNPKKYFRQSQQLDTIPDLSSTVQIHLTSDAICQSDKCLLGNNTSDSTFAVLPIQSARGIFTFWDNHYSGEFSRLYQEPTDLRKIDIQIRDVTGRILSMSADCSLVFEVTYQI